MISEQRDFKDENRIDLVVAFQEFQVQFDEF